MKYSIRNLKESEYILLKDFAYESIFQPDPKNIIPREVLEQSAIKIYYDDFYNIDDIAFLVEIDGNVVGMAWSRLLANEPRGYGNIDEHTPELAISILKEYRNKGLGKALFLHLLAELKRLGYKSVSLSVHKNNYAYKLYSDIGFSIYKENLEDYIMIYTF